MATEQIISIKKFLGLNENPDGDTVLKRGEFAEMRNFRITQDGHLQIRAGSRRLVDFYDSYVYFSRSYGYTPLERDELRVQGAWHGEVNGKTETVIIYGGMAFRAVEPSAGVPYWSFSCIDYSGLDTEADYHLFGFDDRLYLLGNGVFKRWRGEMTPFYNVDGYVPLVQTATTPAGDGTLLEPINRLTAKRRVLFSPDGTSKTFQLPEKGLYDVDSVTLNGTAVTTGWSANTTNGTVTFTTAPTAGTNTLEIKYTAGGGTETRHATFEGDGSETFFAVTDSDAVSIDKVYINDVDVTDQTIIQGDTVEFMSAPDNNDEIDIEYTARIPKSYASVVTSMRFSELYNGAQDTRVFLYGDGSNTTIYSGIPYATGKPSAEYFPDLYDVAVGEANTPITALVRHYSKLMAYKPNSTYAISYGDITLEDGSLTAAFYVQPINRQFGNEAAGQSKILENNPVTIDAGGIYKWKTNRSGYISAIENNLERISDRAVKTLSQMDVSQIKTYNVKVDHEFWFVQGSVALIYNYGNDTWYIYKDLPFRIPLEVETNAGVDVWGFGDNGILYEFTRDSRCDDGIYGVASSPIDCYAITGAMDLGKDYLIKYNPVLYVAMQPEDHSRITITVRDDRRSEYPEREIAYASLIDFGALDFAHFSFGTNTKPQVRRVKFHVRRATFLQIIYKSHATTATATVIQTDIRYRNGAFVK